VRVKENECKEKRRYAWCASKEKNTDAAWEIAGKPGHDGVHHHTWPQYSINGVRHDPGPPHWQAPPLRDGQRWLLPWLASAFLRIPLRPHTVDVPRAQTVFLEEEDHQRERRVANSRTRFRKLSGERKDEGYKGNAQTF